MRRVSIAALALAALLHLPTVAALGQAEPPGTTGTPLASGRLDSVVGMPLFFRLYRVHLPAAAHVSYEGSSAMLYNLSGAATIGAGAGAAEPLAAGGGAYIAAGRIVTIAAAASEPTELLVFLLTARPNQRGPLLDRPAVARELFRTPDALPGLQAGPYAFTLSRLTLPAGAAATTAYSRSGAALDYVLAGTATLTAEGKTEMTTIGMPLFERFGWVHRLANAGAEPLALIEANISQEGAPAVRTAADK